MPAPHLLINGLSMGSGGGYTVGVELWRHLALCRPHWTVTLVLISGYPLHEEVRHEAVPPNCQLLWAPKQTLGRRARAQYERTELVAWVRGSGTQAVLQLNGMVIPGMPCPTVAHCQDPWPYLCEAWDTRLSDPIVAFLKRRAHAATFRRAAAVGFTSHYLRELMCQRLGLIPDRTEVLYNGIPPAWLARSPTDLPDWESRPLEIVTISNVAPYKQQELVIRALPTVLRYRGLESLLYRIAGHCRPAYAEHLLRVASDVGVSNHVVMEGRVPRLRVEALFSQARCYVLMSKCESFGIPAVEAMSFGTPVITANCCAMPEVCGEAALLSARDDVEALSQNLIRVLTDQALAERLRREGLHRLREFSWTKSAAVLAESIASAIA